MKNVFKFSKKYFFIIVLIPIITMELEGNDFGRSENLIIRLILIPIMILSIYLSISDLLENKETSFNRLRWIGFDILMVLLYTCSILQTLFFIIKTKVA